MTDRPQARRLSAREVEVLQLVALGHTTAEAAARLVLSSSTVKAHLARILAALEVPTQAAAVAVALRDGYLEWGLPAADAKPAPPRAVRRPQPPRPPARPAPVAAEVQEGIRRAHELYPSTLREWDVDMIDACRRPIVELLAGKIARLAS